MTASRVLPLSLLLAYALAFGAAGPGVGPLAFDDHPGQLYRVWHVVLHGPAPWAWDDGWWAGYPELQFYPPGFAYAAALLHALSLGGLTVGAAYQVLVWIAWLGPGLAVFIVLAALLRDGWLALPGALVALTLSAGLASGVEGGVHVGMVAARLGSAMLPLLLLSLRPWIEGRPGVPWLAVPLVAAVLLLHPAHVPAAAALVLLAAGAGPRPRRARLAAGVAVLGLGAAVSAFWLLPLLARLGQTRALAWGSLSARELYASPLALVLLALAASLPLLVARGGGAPPGDGSARVLAGFPWVMAIVVAVDALLLEPAGLRWLPADRVVDGAALAVVVAAGLAGGLALRWLSARLRMPVAIVSLAALAAGAALSFPGRTLVLWPEAPLWPSLGAVERGLRLDDLWATLRSAPAGRVLFVRSGVPLVYGRRWGREWWRPHTHVTALTPLATGRGIVGGTFTHPSPVAAALYRGDAGPGAVRHLAEQLDGRTLFGEPLSELAPATLAARLDRLGVAVVVALDEDEGLAALDASAAFARRPATPPFIVYVRRAPLDVPVRVTADRWQVRLRGAAGEWAAARVAYYPLWRVTDGGGALPVRRGPLGDLEVRLDRGDPTAELSYRAGVPETAGLVVTAGALVGSLLGWWRGRASGREKDRQAPDGRRSDTRVAPTASRILTVR